MPPKLPKRWSEAEVTPEIEQAYQDVLDKLLALDFGDKDGEKVPHVLDLSPEAKAAWVTFYNGWAQEQAVAEGELAAAFSKLEAYAARFALVHHVVSRVARGQDVLARIEPESVAAGVTLCRWFANEARRIYAILTESGDERQTRGLVEFIRSRDGAITARELMRSNSRKYPTMEAATTDLDALVKAGLGAWVDRAPTARGGRPTRSFNLSMTHDETDTTPDEGEDEDDGPPDRTPDPPPPPGDFPRASEGSVGCVMRRAEDSGVVGVTLDADGDGENTSGGNGVVSGRCVGTAPAYLLIREPAELHAVRAALDDTMLVGLDLLCGAPHNRSYVAKEVM
jgi:hypothetical protein